MMKPSLTALLGLLAVALSSSAFGAGDAAAGKQKSVTCSACHMADGNSTDPQYPKLAGQHESYLYKQLVDYKSQARANAVMAGMVAALSEEDMRDLAAYFAGQQMQGGGAEEDLVARGEALYKGGDLGRGIPACAACHGASGRGNGPAIFPSLWGQHSDYTEAQLHAFRSWERANDPAQMMRGVAARLSDQDIRAVSSYIEGLRPE